MSMSKNLLTVMVLGLAALAPSCASTNQDEDEGHRKLAALEEDNDNLRKRLTDMNAVETALEREVDAKKAELASARSEVERLRGENATLRASGTERAATVRETEPMRKDAPRVDLSGVDRKNVEVVDSGDGKLRLRLAGTVMFSQGAADLTAEGKRMLDQIGDVLRQNDALFVSVEGHTDNTPLTRSKDRWGTNLALSMARALTVQDYLKSAEKIAERRMRVVGYGEHRPAATGNGKDVLARNRRVELVLANEPL